MLLYLSIQLSNYSPIYPSIYLSIRSYTYLPTYLPTYLSTYPPIHLKYKRPLHHRISANRNRTYYDLNTTNNDRGRLEGVSEVSVCLRPFPYDGTNSIPAWKQGSISSLPRVTQCFFSIAALSSHLRLPQNERNSA